MQDGDYVGPGLRSVEGQRRAALRFGDFSMVEKECIRIGFYNDARTGGMKILFALSFVLGVSIRIISSQVNVMHAGNILMAIGVLGWLLLYARRMANFRPEPEPFRLGIAEGFESTPVSFDEKGRTPFERVRED